jgi:hypothetical protein
MKKGFRSVTQCLFVHNITGILYVKSIPLSVVHFYVEILHNAARRVVLNSINKCASANTSYILFR